MLALIVFRRIYRSFPFFSSYILFSLIEVGASYGFKNFWVHQNIYLALCFVDSAFITAVLGELSMSVLKRFRSSLPQWTLWAAACVLAVAYAAAWQFVKSLDLLARFTSYIAYTICLDLSRSWLQIIFFIALAALSRSLRIGWQSREWQIAAGLGAFSFVNCCATMIQLNYTTASAAHLQQYHVLDELKSFGWCCLMLYWMVSFARQKGEPGRVRQDRFS